MLMVVWTHRMTPLRNRFSGGIYIAQSNGVTKILAHGISSQSTRTQAHVKLPKKYSIANQNSRDSLPLIR